MCYISIFQLSIENQKKFDRSVARIVELAMEADISSRFDDGEVNDEKEMVFLQNKLDRAYGMMCKYFNEGENGGLLYLPGVFKVLIRACLSHQQIDRSSIKDFSYIYILKIYLNKFSIYLKKIKLLICKGLLLLLIKKQLKYLRVKVKKIIQQQTLLLQQDLALLPLMQYL